MTGLWLMLSWGTHVVHVSKPTDHVKPGAWMLMMCRCWFVVIHLSLLEQGRERG